MTPDEIQQLRTGLTNIREAKPEDKLAHQFPDTDLSLSRVHHYNYAEFVVLLQRVVSQFESELDGLDGRYLPAGFQYNSNTLGNTYWALSTIIANLAAHVSNPNWDQAAYYLELAIAYQHYAGIWNREGRRWHSVSRLRHHELFSELEIKAKQIQVLLAEVQNLKSEQANAVSRRETDAQAIATQLDTVQKNSAEIAALLGKSNGDNGQLTQILATQKTNLVSTSSELDEIAKTKTQLAETLKDATAKLSSSDERLKFMETKANWVNEIAGTAAAGVLGQKFEARMRQLSTASNYWLAGTVASVVAAAAWLGIAHVYFTNTGNDVWLTLALNFGLLLPAVFIVGFFAKQFGKVRQFEEEYAFRASIAMTLGAFADRLGADALDPRNKLISETVEKLYRLPVLLQEREPHGWFSQRSTERMLKATTELVSAVKTPPR